MNIEHAPLKLAFSVNNFCKAIDIGRTRFYQEVSEGRIKTVKCGGKTLVTATEAARYISTLTENAA